MMKYIRLLTFLCLLPIGISAQVVKEYNAFGEIYRLTTDEARRAYLKKVDFDSTWLHTLVGSNDTISQDRLPPGHYLLITAQKEQIVAGISSVFPFGVQVLNTYRDFAFVLTDTSGARIRDAVATLKGKRVPFDEKMQCYRLKKHRKGGILEITSNGTTWFYNVEKSGSVRSIYKQHWQRFWMSPPGRVAVVPYVFALRTWRGIWHYNDYKRYHRYHGSRIFRRENKLNRNHQFKGYVAFSQPKYRPGDTLEVKAWVETQKGKAWNKPLELEIKEQKKYKTVKKITLSPTSPGHFEFRMAMSDSLLIDSYYFFKFIEKEPVKKGLFGRIELEAREIQRRVYYEDYVLDEVKYTFTTPKNLYSAKDSIIFHLSARDGNNQPIPDGSYQLVVQTVSDQAFYAPEVYLPDTLWHTEGTVPMSGELDIRMPDNLFPLAKYALDVRIYCTTSSGELQEKKLSFVVDRQSPRPHIEAAVKKGWLLVDWTEQIANVPKVKITEQRKQQEPYSYEVSLPFRAPVKPDVYGYTMVAGEELQYLNLYFNPNAVHGVLCNSYRIGDTVLFVLQNPHKIPVQYRISRDKSVYEEGAVFDSIWVKKIIDPSNNNFDLIYTFIWGGETIKEKVDLDYYRKILDVQIEQPQQVMPGETVQIKVKVRGENKKPATSVDITAGAVNTLFNDIPYDIPAVTERIKPGPFFYKLFEINALQDKEYQLPLNEKWYKRLRLDQNPYYKMRHLKVPGNTEVPPAYASVTPISPDAFLDASGKPIVFPQQDGRLPGFPLAKDSFYQTRPQFVPYIIKDYQSQPIYMVWVNERLVYYYNGNDQQPYSFYGNYGYNTIKIRTRDGQYVLDSVYLEKKQKHTLAVYGAEWETKPQKIAGKFPFDGTALHKARIRWESRPDTLTLFEQNYLRQSMLPLLHLKDHHQKIFVWESFDNIHQIVDNSLNNHVVGPFPPGTNLKALYTDAFFTEFRFEPGYDYEVVPGRERLYLSKAWWMPVKLPELLPVKPMNQWAIGPQHIQRNSETMPRYTFIGPGADKKGAGKLKIYFPPKDTLLKGFALRGTLLTGPYSPFTTAWYGLVPGQYTLLVYTQKGSIATRQVTIRRDTLTYIDLSDLLFRAADTMERFDTHFPPVNLSGEKTRPRTGPIPSDYPGWEFGAILEGTIKDENGEELIGAAVKLMNGTFFVKGTIADVNGRYSLKNVPPGIYDLEITYTGFNTEKVEGLIILDRLINYVDTRLRTNPNMQEVLISAYGVALVRQDQTSGGHTLTSDVIRGRPTRSVNAIVANTAGFTSLDGSDVHIKGSRTDATTYYMDGIRTTDGAISVQDLGIIAPSSPRSDFKDHAYFRPNLTTDDKGEVVFEVTFPDNITGWNSYAIAAGGKGRFGVGNTFTRSFKPLTAQLAVPRFAVTGDHFDVAGRVSNYTDDSLTMTTRFRVDDRLIREKTVRLGEGWSEFAGIDIPATSTDTIAVSYETAAGKVTDGEVRQIPVIPAGVVETTGQFLLLEGDTSLLFTPDPTRGPVTFYAQNNVLDLLLADVEYLRLYPYGCNEQTASRLTALLALKKIMVHLQKPFLYEKDIHQCLKRLKSTQQPNGTWGWWAEGAANNWMTLYVARAQQKARIAGYQTPGLDEAIAMLQLLLPGMHYADQQETLSFLRTCNINIDCKNYLVRYDSLAGRLKDYGLSHRLNHLKMLQLCGAKVEKDSLLPYLQHTTFGGIYCGAESTDWYSRRAVNTLLVYEIAWAAGWTDITAGIRQYWLESRKEHRNTIETAQILDILLPEMLAKTNTNIPTTLSVGQQEFKKFPATLQFMPEKNQSISIAKTGAGPVFANIYQQWQNPRPEPRSDIFEVKTRLLTAEDKPTGTLKYGEAATLEVTVKVKAAADYVMIEVPIPSGCGYGAKIQPYSPEVHREYFKDRTAIFCEQLKVGEYTFRIPLEARFTGQFTLNPAKVEQMYFPVFFGRNEMGRMAVTK